MHTLLKNFRTELYAFFIDLQPRTVCRSFGSERTQVSAWSTGCFSNLVLLVTPDLQ